MHLHQPISGQDERNEFLEVEDQDKLKRALRIRPRWAVVCCVVSLVTFTFYALFALNVLLTEELIFMGKDKESIGDLVASAGAGNGTKVVPISSEEVTERFMLAIASQAASFLTAIGALSLWKCCAHIDMTWSMLCYFVFRGCTVGALLAVYFESWGLNVKMAVDIPQKSTFLIVLCSMIVVGLAEETAKIIALTFNLARRMEEVGPPDGCFQKCRLFRTLVESPQAFMICGVATGYGFMIIENFEYFMVNATQPDFYGRHDSARHAAMFGDFSRMYTAITRNMLNPHPLFTGIAAGIMAQYYYGPGEDAIPLGGTLSMSQWAKVLGVSIVFHATFDFFAMMLGNWIEDALTYILVMLGLQVFFFVASLIIVIRQWRKIREY